VGKEAAGASRSVANECTLDDAKNRFDNHQSALIGNKNYSKKGNRT
jgi:hypothetical protein